MAIETRKPPMKETVGAQYIVINKMDEDNQWTSEYEAVIEKLKTVKSVKVSEKTETLPSYGSGELYDSDSETSSIDIEVEALAFVDETVSKLKADEIGKGGLILSGGKRIRPYFAYGKVVLLRGGKFRFDWYPKCKLTENSDDSQTKEDKSTEQTDTLKITAYPFNAKGDIVAKVSSDVNCPEGLTEEKFFSKVILTDEDLAAVVAPVQQASASSTK